MDTYPVVVVVGQVQLAKVDVAQGVRVADQIALPVVVEVVPGDSDPVAAANGIELAVVVVGADLWGELGFELVVVDPDPGAVLDGDAVVVDDEADGEVTDDNICRVNDCDAVLTNLCIVVYTENGLVAADAQAGWQVDAALDVDGARRCSSNGSDQGGAIGDSDHFALLTSSSLADGVVFCVADEIEATELARGVLLFPGTSVAGKARADVRARQLNRTAVTFMTATSYAGVIVVK
jgi:hypothetical protein